MKNSLNFSSGFTLIELLVVVTLVGVIGVMTSQIFITGLRSSGKSEVLKEVKQNGDYALYVLENMIRNSTDIITDTSSCNSDNTSLSLLNSDGFYTTFRCDAGTGQIASESSAILSGPLLRTENLTNNKVAVSNCNFRIVCPTPAILPKYAFINFTLSQAGSSLPLEQQATLNYQTTIGLRVYE